MGSPPVDGPAADDGTDLPAASRRRWWLAGAAGVLLLVAGGVAFAVTAPFAGGQDTAGETAGAQAADGDPVSDDEDDPSDPAGDPEDADDEPDPEPDPDPEPPLDPTTFEVDELLPSFHEEAHRAVFDDDRSAFIVFSFPDDVDGQPFTATLFVEDRGTYELTDQVELACGYGPTFHDDDGMVYVDCPSGATAHNLWAVERNELSVRYHPNVSPDDEIPFGWYYTDWERTPVDGEPDELTLLRRDCIPSCPESGLIGTHIAYDPGLGWWQATGCTAADGTLLELDDGWNEIPGGLYGSGAGCEQEVAAAGLSLPECHDAYMGPRPLVDCLIAAVNADDRDMASKMATGEVVADMFGYRDFGDGSPLEWDFNGCEDESCWYYEESSDPQFHGVGIEFGIDRDGDNGNPQVIWVDTYG